MFMVATRENLTSLDAFGLTMVPKLIVDASLTPAGRLHTPLGRWDGWGRWMHASL